MLATGSTSKTFGLEIGGRVLTSTEALNLDYVPKSAIVLGGGVIGVEFASVWNSFGVDVTIVEGLPCLVPNEDPAIIKVLERSFKKRGIKFNTGVFFEKVEQDATGAKVTLADGKVLEADIVLVAVGRGPVTEGLGFEEQGITAGPRLRASPTSACTPASGNIYAIGDIVPGVQLAHRGYQQGIFVAEEIAGQNPVVVEDINIPKVTYCEPEIMSVGYSEPAAKEKFGDDQIEIHRIQPGRQRQVLHPGHLRPDQDGPRQERPDRRRARHRRPHRRADRRGPADRELGGLPGGRGAADPRPPDPERSPGRGRDGPRRQAAARLDRHCVPPAPAGGTHPLCRRRPFRTAGPEHTLEWPEHR